MHGDGQLRKCRGCGQSIKHLDQSERLGWPELRGPREITSSNIDRFFDDNGLRFLAIEEKAPGERPEPGQRRMLQELSRESRFTVWLVRGTQQYLSIHELAGTKETLVGCGDFETYQAKVLEWFKGEGLCECGAAVGMRYCSKCAPL